MKMKLWSTGYRVLGSHTLRKLIYSVLVSFSELPFQVTIKAAIQLKPCTVNKSLEPFQVTNAVDILLTCLVLPAKQSKSMYLSLRIQLLSTILHTVRGNFPYKKGNPLARAKSTFYAKSFYSLQSGIYLLLLHLSQVNLVSIIIQHSIIIIA